MALRGDGLALLLAANLALALAAAFLGAGGLYNHGKLAPAVALRGDHGVLAVDDAADGALAVGLPAVVGAGGLLALIADPAVPLAADGEGILRVDLFDRVLGDLLPLGVGVLLALILALVEFLIQLFERLGMGFLGGRAADRAVFIHVIDAGLPIEGGLDTGVVTVLNQIVVVHDGLKMVLAGGRNRTYDFPAVAADRADHLHIAIRPAGRRDRGRLKRADMPLVRARRQRQQRQTHQYDQYQRKGSYKFLTHGVKPRYLK